MIKFKVPDDQAVEFIAANMREADAVEVWASGHYTPIDAVRKSLEYSKFATVVWIDDVPCAIFGLSIYDVLSGTGVPWLLSAEQILNHKREILKHSPDVIEMMLEICPKLMNHVHAENKVSIRWLRWLGFDIDEAKPEGRDGALFHRFHKDRGESCVIH